MYKGRLLVRFDDTNPSKARRRPLTRCLLPLHGCHARRSLPSFASLIHLPTNATTWQLRHIHLPTALSPPPAPTHIRIRLPPLPPPPPHPTPNPIQN
jgi:hypothetical protein